MPRHDSIWRAAQERLRQQLTHAQFETWLRGTHLTALEDGQVVLQVRSSYAKDVLEGRYLQRIEEAISGAMGQICSLSIAVAQTDAPRRSGVHTAGLAHAQHDRAAQTYTGPGLFDGLDGFGNNDAMAEAPQALASHAKGSLAQRDPRASAMDSAPAPQRHQAHERRGPMRPANDDLRADDGSGPEDSTPRTQATPRTPTFDALPGQQPGSGSFPTPALSRPLNARYTFDTFIVGNGNQLAHAASVAVAEAPGMAYNPLFLYGGVGLGKTHLLHAIGHHAMSSGLHVVYVTSETFTNEIVNAIRFRTTEEFRAKYRYADVLLIDDVQFIAGKDSTEEEFFHTFNSLYEANRQIVMCSDRPPKAMVALQERLRSRFEWGLIADIQPPDLETRVAILHAKAEGMRFDVPDDVMQFLAGRVQSNIRELEGTLTRLLAFARLQGQPLTVETARSSMQTLASDQRQKRVEIGEILQAVADYYRLPFEDLQGKQRDKHIVVPRQVAMYLMRQETESSLLEIGQALGGRDHSTVLHGCEKISREINENTALRKDVLSIRQQLLG
jgi:chromosomal replication initiator protein